MVNLQQSGSAEVFQSETQARNIFLISDVRFVGVVLIDIQEAERA